MLVSGRVDVGGFMKRFFVNKSQPKLQKLATLGGTGGSTWRKQWEKHLFVGWVALLPLKKKQAKGENVCLSSFLGDVFQGSHLKILTSWLYKKRRVFGFFWMAGWPGLPSF